MPFRRWFRERAGSRAERPGVENRDTDRMYQDEIETLRDTNATLARQMLQQEARMEEEKEELRKKMRRQDARMLMKDNQILKMKRAVDEQSLEIQEYKEQVAELEEKLETSKARFAARAERWRQKVNKTAEEVFTDFQLKCQKQIKEQLHYAHEELADLRFDLQDSRDEVDHLLQELMVLHQDMAELQRLFSADRWEDVVGSALWMKDRCAELEVQGQENRDLREELDILRQELYILQSPPPAVVLDSIYMSTEETDVTMDELDNSVTLDEEHESLCEEDAAILNTSLPRTHRLDCGDDQT
ncbi:uncharacterized protein LOC144921202 [Branchiostoma floridae x Branchiostoma belcheri]